ncbi:FAD/NAD(P)-binding domain-containing protein [Hypoxylon sp. NC1633]|nr:FAD/NAD(P)-binding domain-containing protein [Hypoxylon sp. NC1633]
MLEKTLLVLKGIRFGLSVVLNLLRHSLEFRLKLLRHSIGIAGPSPSDKLDPPRNIVIVGASIAGYTAAKTIAQYLLPDSGFRVVVVEPRSHFHFTWVLPRFCVVEGHEHKAFIPYGGYLPAGSLSPKDQEGEGEGGRVTWVQDRVKAIERDRVRLQGGGPDIPYAFLVVATGAGAADSLPSRVPATTKEAGLQLLREMQRRVREARDLVVVGGGAAGVELATDAKSRYPDKRVALVHSRDAVMHRFGPRLRDAARRGIEELGVELITGDRVVREDKERRVAVLGSGREIVCDYLVNCTGQAPDSRLVAELSPASISPSGHVLTKPTLQIRDESLPNVYVCGDVSETNTTHPNSRSAMRQAMIVGYNVVAAAEGRRPRDTYEPHWLDGVIKLTLGLDKSVVNVGDGETEFVVPTKEKDVALMSADAWRRLGAKPFEDDERLPTSKIMAKI